MSRSLPADSPPDVGVIIPAGGTGERAGGGMPKQFREIAGVPMLLRAIRPFIQLPFVAQVVVPLPPRYLDAPPEWLSPIAGERVQLVAGGATRAESVFNGLQVLPESVTTVLVHDAARPFVSADVITEVASRARKGEAVLAAVPATDTLKRVNASLNVVETVDRSVIWRAQTPQGFPRNLLTRAYDHLHAHSGTTTPTDEASLVEMLGEPVQVVRDAESNVKITTARDFDLAESLARVP